MSSSKSTAEAKSRIAKSRSRKWRLQNQDLKFGILAAILNEQATELRKVGAQLQISNAAAQAVAKNP